MEYPICTQSVKEKNFGIACLQKKFVFQSEISTHSVILFSKTQKFYRFKELFKSNQTRYGVSHVYLESKRKKNSVQFVWEKVRTSIGNFGLLAYHTLILFSKIQNFYRVKELSKSNQTRYGVSHVHVECKTKKIFGIACLQKSSFFNRNFRLLRLFYFQKNRNFIGTRNCPKRTKLGMEYPICTQSVKEKNFGIACLGKQFVFQSDISAYSLIIRLFYFQKYRNFIGSRSCPNQTIRYGVSRVYLERKTKRFFVIACLQKKFVFQSEISTHSVILFSKIQKFYRFKELFKSNQTRYGVSPVYLESKRKKNSVQFVWEKVRISIGNFGLLAYHTLILFSKIQKFYRVKELSKSNQTRYGVSHVHVECKTKRIFGIACLQKSSFFNRNFRLLRLFYFQKIEILSGQGIVQNEPNSVWSIPFVPRA